MTIDSTDQARAIIRTVTGQYADDYTAHPDMLDRAEDIGRAVIEAVQFLRGTKAPVKLPQNVLDALTTLRRTQRLLHAFDEDNEPADGDYRYHDEHNADVNERIADCADHLATAIEQAAGIIKCGHDDGCTNVATVTVDHGARALCINHYELDAAATRNNGL